MFSFFYRLTNRDNRAGKIPWNEMSYVPDENTYRRIHADFRAVRHWHESGIRHFEQTRLAHPTYRVRSIRAGKKSKKTEIVIKRVHEASSEVTMTTIEHNVRTYNSGATKHPAYDSFHETRDHFLVMPNAYPLGKDFLIMHAVEFPTAREISVHAHEQTKPVNQQIHPPTTHKEVFQNCVGYSTKHPNQFNESEILACAARIKHFTGIKLRNLFFVGTIKGKLAFMPLPDLV
jgi:hypothetical protein